MCTYKHLKFELGKLNLLSANVRGLNTDEIKRKIYSWLHESKKKILRFYKKVLHAKIRNQIQYWLERAIISYVQRFGSRGNV